MIFRSAPVCLLAALAVSRASAAEPEPAAAANPPAVPAPAPTGPPVPTVIESDTADMVSNEKETMFTFRKNVAVTGTNMKITCDDLVVIARRAGDPAATLGKQEKFKSLVATGHVQIVQGDRETTCDRAEIFPGEDKVELTGNLVVRSTKEGWTQTGESGTLWRGQRRAEIKGTATQRPQLTLPPLKDLGDLGNKGKDKKADAKKSDEKASPEKSAGPDALPPLTVPLPPPPK